MQTLSHYQRFAGQIKAADKLLEEAESRHEKQTAPLYARQFELLEARKEASAAQKDLFESCDDTVLHAMLNQVTSELNQSLEKTRDLLAQVSFYRTKADNERHRANRELKSEDRDHRLEQAANIDERIGPRSLTPNLLPFPPSKENALPITARCDKDKTDPNALSTDTS